jgi:hypothetical protein
LSLGCLRRRLESFIDGRVCPQNVEVSIQHQEGLVRCIENGLGIIECQLQFIVQFIKFTIALMDPLVGGERHLFVQNIPTFHL